MIYNNNPIDYNNFEDLFFSELDVNKWIFLFFFHVILFCDTYLYSYI